MKSLPLVVILICLVVRNSYQQGLNCYVPADVLILLDGSDSIQDRDWTNAKTFVKQLVRQFDVARDAIHIGMIVYSSNIGDHISFSPFKPKTMLEILATSLRHPKQSTNTAKGIEYARTQFKLHGRPGAPKILIVITDGSSDSPRNTKSQAELAKIEGISILALGVGGQVFKDELRQIASKPRKVFTATSFITLQGLISEIRNMVCQVITTTTTSTTPRPIPTRPMITVPVPKGRLCEVAGDIVFLIDGSDSISDIDFSRQKNFVANMIDNFEIGKEYIHAGIVVFSTVIGDTVGLQPSRSKELLKILTKNLRHPKIGTNTALGIERVRKMMREQGRSFAPKIMVVITDGKSSSPALTELQASLAKAEGLSVIAIGVGSAIYDYELNKIGSAGQVFKVTRFEDLERIINTMRDRICQSITTTTSTTTTTPATITIPPPQGLICEVPADIGFILDGSDSISPQDWPKGLNFVANVINNLDISPQAIHVGIVVYSTLVGEKVNLNPYKPKPLLIALAKKLKQPKLGTNTAIAIDTMRDMFRQQGRPDSPKVMIIVTDGKSTNPGQTKIQAERAKAEGVTVITVGIGGSGLFKDEIRNIATNQRKVFEVVDYQSLTSIIQQLRDLICQVITTTAMISTTTSLPPTYPPIPGCDLPAEIMILTHGSENINEYNWDKNKDFISSLIRNLFVGQNSHHIGFVVYSTSVGDTIGLSPYKDTFDLTNFANSLIHPGKGANAAAGLKKLREVYRTQARSKAPRIAIVITDQTSTDEDATRVEAELAKKEGIHFMTIGVGNNISPRELQGLSSSERHITRVNNFDDLQTIMPQIRQQICDLISKPKGDEFSELCSGCLINKASGFNPFPGDCSKYVQCWTDNNRVMGTVKKCPFGQFWDREKLACGAALNVHCPADPCKHSPDGFTYGMKNMGCKAHWLCVNGHSVGTCCATGSYYIEGMGCMRGDGCKEPCPPEGGILLTPDCSKEQHWDERYYIEKVPHYGKLVRPCPPGTVFSKSYCNCIVANLNGLFPILPGDQCRPSAHFNYDVDMKDKSGTNVATSYLNVGRTRYGTAQFNGNSEMSLWKNTNVDFSNKLVIRFKFKFDRWTDRFDYGGVIVDMGKGGDVHWKHDVQSGWTRNITVGSGWDIKNLVKLFRSLINSRTEPQMKQNMWKIANSMDFKTLLYQLGFVPDTSNGMQILRIMLNGNGANFLREIVTQLEKQKTHFDMRVTLKRLLSRPEMRAWILQNTGPENIQITMKNWRRFLESLEIPESDLKIGDYSWYIPNDKIGTGSMSSTAIIADLWRTFVRMMGMDDRAWKDLLRITLGNAAIGGGGRIDVEFLNEMKNVLGRNQTILQQWHNFLQGKNSFITLDKTNPIQKWWEKIYATRPMPSIPGIDSSQSVGVVADLWRKFMQEAQLPLAKWGPKLTWTYGKEDASVEDLFKEIQNVLGDSKLRDKWTKFIQAHYSKTGPGQTDSIIWKPGKKGEIFWKIIFGQGPEINFGPGGETTQVSVAVSKLADLWRTFITSMNLKGPKWDKLLKWTNTYKPGSKIDVKTLLHEIKQVVMADNNVDTAWLKFLNDNGVDASWFLRILFSEQEGPVDENWVYWYLYRNKDYATSGTGNKGNVNINSTIFPDNRSTDKSVIIDLWRRFITQSRLGPEWNGLLVWTLGSGSNGGSGDHMEWIYELTSVLRNKEMRGRWINYLNTNNVGNEWLNWFSVISGESGSNTGGSGVDTSGLDLSLIMQLWKRFVTAQNLNGNQKWNKILTWTLGGGLTDRYLDWSNEVVGVLQNATMRDLWFKFLHQSDAGGVWINWFRMILDVQGSTSTSSGSGGNWMWHYISNGMTVPLDVLSNLWIQFVYDRNLGYGQWADSLWYTLNAIPGAITADEYVHLFNEMTILMMDEYVRNEWINFLQGNDITASWSIVGGGMGGTTGSAESIDAILNSLSGGTSSGSFGSSGSSSSSGGDFFWPVDWDFDGGFSRKRRSVGRQRRAAVNKLAHVPLVSNCGTGGRPSISITANEQNVKMSLMTQGAPAELEIPLIQGWNEVTMVYDGRNLHGTVQNWRGKQNKKKPLSGNVAQRRGLTFGACGKEKFRGQLDDIVVYKCVPKSLEKQLR